MMPQPVWKILTALVVPYLFIFDLGRHWYDFL